MNVGTKEQLIEKIDELQRAYRGTFEVRQPANIMVMEDLSKFCRATETCGVPGDHDKTFTLIGRHEVWLRIQQFLELNPEQLFLLFARATEKLRSTADGR